MASADLSRNSVALTYFGDWLLCLHVKIMQKLHNLGHVLKCVRLVANFPKHSGLVAKIIIGKSRHYTGDYGHSLKHEILVA